MKSIKRIAAAVTPFALAGAALLGAAGSADASSPAYQCTGSTPEICVGVYYSAGPNGLIHVDHVQVQLKSSLQNVRYEVTGAWSSGGWTEYGLVNPEGDGWESAWQFGVNKNFSPSSTFCGHASYAGSTTEVCVAI